MFTVVSKRFILDEVFCQDLFSTSLMLDSCKCQNVSPFPCLMFTNTNCYAKLLINATCETQNWY